MIRKMIKGELGMKKKGWLIVLIAMLMILSLGMTACKPKPTPEGPTPEEPNPPAPAAAVTLDVEAGRIDIYDTLTLTATTENTDEAVKWETSDAGIASVDGGVVTGVSEGQVTITASAGGAKATCTVTVYNSYTAPVMEIDFDRVAIAKDGSFGVSVKTLWKGKEINETVNYSWTLGEDEDDTVAGVSASGNSATFTGKEYGEATYYVSATVRGVALVKKVTVKVCNVDITFGIANLAPVANAYQANLGLVATDKDVTAVIPEVSVYNKGALVPTANIAWTTDDADIASVDPTTGEITAVGEGVTYVRGSYDNNDVAIKVNAYRSEIALGETLYFETYKIAPLSKGVATSEGADRTIAIPASEIAGTVNGATLDGKEICDSFDAANKTLTVDATEFSVSKSAMGTVLQFELNTEKAIYTADAQIVTMAVRTRADLDKMGEIAANQSKDWMSSNGGVMRPWHWDGYFALANDIEYNVTGDYTNKFKAFICYNTLEGAGVKLPDSAVGKESNSWNNGRLYGWLGTFDGQNHNIKGMTIDGSAGGMFGVMGSEGIVRNVSFTEAKHTAWGGFVSAAGCGRIENVYIQCNEQTGGNENNNDKNAFVYSNDVMAGAVVKNVFIDTNFGTGTVGNLGIGAVHEGYGIYQGVYCVGTTNGYRLLSTGGGDKNVCGAYNNYSDLVNSGAEFASWENDFWRVVNGVPFPRNLTAPSVDTAASVASDYVAAGGSVKVSADRNAVVKLDNLASSMGVKLSGGVITVPSTIKSGTYINFNVTSAFDETVSASYRVRVVDNRIVTVETERDLYLNKLEDNFQIDLSAQVDSIAGTFMSATVGGKYFADATYASGKLTLDKASIAKAYGSKTISASFEIHDGGGVTGFVTVNIPVRIVTMLITTEAELNQWVSVAYDVDERANYANGLFELGDDIKCTGIYPSTQRSGVGDGRGGGFWGTFDGKGHVIDGLHMQGANVGFVHCLGGAGGQNRPNIYDGGVIKNVAFINAFNEGNGAFISSTGTSGTIENVFISIKATPKNAEWGNANGTVVCGVYGPFTTRNVLVEYLNEIPEGSKDGYPAYELHYFGNNRGFYAVGVSKMSTQLGDQSGAKGNLEAYPTYDAFKEGVVASDWDEDCWTITDGVPVHKAVIAYDGYDVSVGAVDSIAAAGNTVKIDANGGYVKYTLDDAAEEAGVTIDHFGVMTVPASVQGGIEFTVTVGSYAKDSIAIAKTFRTATNRIINIEERQDVEYKGTGDDFAIDLSEYNVEGSVHSVTMGSVNFARTAMNGDELTLDRASLKGNWGERTIVAIFHKTNTSGDVVGVTTVNIPVFSVAKIIKTKEDFNSWYPIAKELANNDGLYYEGYFVLGNDIDYENTEFNMFWDWNYCKGNGHGDDWVNGRNLGFRGTFDGRGHIIKNMVWKSWVGSIFGTIANGGIIKNIGFVNYQRYNNGGALLNGGEGTVENVFMEMNIIANNGGNDSMSGIISHDCMGGMRVKNVFVDASGEFNENTFALGKFHKGFGILNNVYCVGQAGQAAWKIISGDGTNDVWGAYADYAAFKAANNDLTAFENDFWTVKNGIPVPKALLSKAITISNTDLDIVAGNSVKITCDGVYRTLSVDDAAKEAGIYFVGDTVYVPAGVGGMTFDVIAKSVINDEIEARKTFTVISRTSLDIEYYGAGDNVSVDLSAYGLSGTLASVKLGDNAIEGCGLSDSTLAIPKAELEKKANWGEWIMSVATDEKTVKLFVTVATKVIDTKDEMNGWHTIAKEVANQTGYWDGYFVLGSDIDYADTNYTVYYNWSIWDQNYRANGSWTFGRSLGFRGTFDGRGYVIKNMKLSGGSNSVFGVLANGGLIKNMTFTGYTADGSAGLVASCAGNIENLYVEVKSTVKGSYAPDNPCSVICGHDALGEARVKNAFIRYDAGVTTTATSLIGRFHKGFNSLKNVYCIGQTGASSTWGADSTDPAWKILSGDGDGDVMGAYQTAADMKAANIAINTENGWDMTFWTTDADGLPIPQALKTNA